MKYYVKFNELYMWIIGKLSETLYDKHPASLLKTNNFGGYLSTKTSKVKKNHIITLYSLNEKPQIN